MTSPLSTEPSTPRALHVPPELRTLAVTALLLERLERMPRTAAQGAASADQYRSVVQRVALLLADAPAGDALQRLLATFPATAQVYENLHYDTSGLCRSPLDVALQAELSATAALQAAAAASRKA